MTITALPTTYAGTTFRSRLEADWAATLDDRNINWDYEPEGYLLTDGTKYLPDFYLPTVRGTHDPASPLVITGHSPIRREGEPSWFSAHMVGIMGPGNSYSIGFTKCHACEASTIFAFGQPFCRTCFAAGELIQDELHFNWMEDEYSQRPFMRLPRPYQNGGRQ